MKKLLLLILLLLFSNVSYSDDDSATKEILKDYKPLILVGDLNRVDNQEQLDVIITYNSYQKEISTAINNKTWETDLANKKFNQPVIPLTKVVGFRYFLFPVIAENMAFYSNMCNGYASYAHIILHDKDTGVSYDKEKNVLKTSLNQTESLTPAWKELIMMVLDRSYAIKKEDNESFKISLYQECASAFIEGMKKELKATNGEELTPLVN